MAQLRCRGTQPSGDSSYVLFVIEKSLHKLEPLLFLFVNRNEGQGLFSQDDNTQGAGLSPKGRMERYRPEATGQDLALPGRAQK